MKFLGYSLVFLTFLFYCNYVKADSKIVCYYDSSAFYRPAQGKFDVSFLDHALQFCSHLIYGYAAIDEKNFKLVPLDRNLDVDNHNYKKVTDLKKRFPGLKVLLSVGGGKDGKYDDERKVEKYLKVIETPESRAAFVNSTDAYLKNYGFDGLDLAWEFPETQPKVVRGFFGNLKDKVFGKNAIDKNAEEHKEEFTSLVREIKNRFKHEGLSLSLSVLPNVNASLYYDPSIAQFLDLIILKAFDFYTPYRNPKEADYVSPLYELYQRKFDENCDYQVRYWKEHGTPRNKIILAIPAYGRAWKTSEDSGLTGVPPVKELKGAADPGPYSNIQGLLSHTEICNKLANPLKLTQAAGTHLKKVGDPSGRHGVFAYRAAKKDEEGLWVAYDDIEYAGSKAAYAKEKGLGGIAIDDLTLDDFRGLCSGNKYPVLRGAKIRL